MGYTITTKPKQRVTIVKYVGEIGLQIRETAVQEVTNIIMAFGYDSILVDLREAQITMSASEQCSFGTLLGDNKYFVDCRTAYLVKRDQHDNDFIETIALNRGYTFHTFTSELMAYEWLGI